MSPAHSTAYPYRLKPVIKPKIWGGHNLEQVLGKQVASGEMIGETWEAWEGCVIENGAHAGQTLDRVIALDAAGVLGSAYTRAQRFPLLFKFIDAQDDLSVQVHPDDAEAQEMEHYPYGKTESWYILHSEPGAHLILGWNHPVQTEQVARSIQENSLVDLLAAVPVQRGDVLFVPAGTVHAIGRGIVLAEIQENSDITYRLYDWGREAKGRELHITQSLRVMDCNPIPQSKIASLVVQSAEYDRRWLVACRYFCSEVLDVRRRTPPLTLKGKFQIVASIRGSGSVRYGPDMQESVAVPQGQTLLLPANLESYAVEPVAGPCEIFRAYVPNLEQDVITPLRGAGYDAAAIARLGGAVAEHNDLLLLLR